MSTFELYFEARYSGKEPTITPVKAYRLPDRYKQGRLMVDHPIYGVQDRLLESDNYAFFTTWEACQAWLLVRNSEDIAIAQARLDDFTKRRQFIKAMQQGSE